MRATYLLAVLIAAGASPTWAQGGGQSGKVTQSLNARANATDAIKSGNGQSGVAQLRSAVKQGPAAKSEDVQVISELCVIARTLTVEQHTSAAATVQLAETEAGKARGKLARADAAYVDAQLGELYERFVGDGRKARQYYNSALAQDGTRKDASDGLRRLDRLEALLQARAQENVRLRSGGK